MLLAAAAAAALSFGGSGCVDALCDARALEPWFAKLQASRGGSGRPIHILQIGDSHTAGDAITGAWRDLLQQRYGAGGRGVLPPGRPYDGYITHGVTVSMSPGWRIVADFGAGWSGAAGTPLGLSAFSLTSQTEGASMSLVADANEQFNRFTVCAVARLGAGNLQLRAGSQSVTFDLGSPSERPACRTMRLDQPATNAQVVASGGPATVTSWATFRDGGGVALSNLGVVGSQLIHFSRTDDAVLAEELRAYQPDLLVVAFGTNEGFTPHFTAFEYEIVLRTQIGRLRRLAGNVPILILGAPDALSRRAEMRANAAGGPAVSCGDIASAAPAPAPASTQPGVIAGIMDRLRTGLGLASSDQPAAATPPAPPPVAAPPPASRGPLFPPPALKAVRDVQRRVAASLNVAFWDWEARMGGRCTASRWVRASPPLMRGDYVHYTSAGGREIAARLQADLDKAMAQ